MGKYGPNLTWMLHCKLCFFHSQPGFCPNYGGTIRRSLALKQILIRILLQSTKHSSHSMRMLCVAALLCVFMANTFLEVRISHIILLTRGRNCRTSRGHSRFLQGRKSHTPFQLMRLHRLMFSSNFTGVNPCFGGCLLSGRSLLVSYLSRLVYSFECGHCDSQCVGERFSSCMHDYRACASASIASGGEKLNHF